MQWVTNQNRGTPSTDFIGGFSFPQMYVSLLVCASCAEQVLFLQPFVGEHRQCFSPSFTMFTEPLLNICIRVGREQQTVTVTTPGMPDVQLASTPQFDYQHSYGTSSHFSYYNSPSYRYFPEYARFLSFGHCYLTWSRSSFPGETRQRGVSFQTTYTRVYKTSHSRSRKHSKNQHQSHSSSLSLTKTFHSAQLFSRDAQTSIYWS